MSNYAGRPPRQFSKALEVKCPLCGKTDSMTPRQRNDRKHPGKWCDGSYGERHEITLMVGPDLRAYA